MIAFLLISNIYRIGKFWSLGAASKVLPFLLYPRKKVLSSGLVVCLAAFVNLFAFSAGATPWNDEAFEIIKAQVFAVLVLFYFDSVSSRTIENALLGSSLLGAVMVYGDFLGASIYDSYPEFVRAFASYRAIGNFMNPNEYAILAILSGLINVGKGVRRDALVALTLGAGALTFSKWYFLMLPIVLFKLRWRVSVALVGFGVFLFARNLENLSEAGVNRILDLVSFKGTANDLTTNRADILSQTLESGLSFVGKGLSFAQSDYGFGEGAHNMFLLMVLNGGIFCGLIYLAIWSVIIRHCWRNRRRTELFVLLTLTVVSHNLMEFVIFQVALLFCLKFSRTRANSGPNA